MLQEILDQQGLQQEPAPVKDAYITTDVKQSIGWDTTTARDLVTEAVDKLGVRQDSSIFYLVDNTGKVMVFAPYKAAPQDQYVNGSVMPTFVDVSEQNRVLERVNDDNGGHKPRMGEFRETRSLEKKTLEASQRTALLNLMDRMEIEYPTRSRVAIVADNMEQRYVETMDAMGIGVENYDP